MRLSNKYYSGREVQKKLGITEPALRNLVNKKKIKKFIPPGRKYGVYLRSEIDRFAEKREALLMAKEPPKTLFKIAKPADLVAEYRLETKAMGSNGMPADVKRQWLAANDESDYHVYHANKLVAFFYLVPLRKEIIEPFIQGALSWKEITPQRDIQKYEQEKAVDLFVQGIASNPDIDKTRRTYYMLVLLRGVGNELEKLGRRGILIEKIYARSQTPTGIAMAMHLGMSEYAPLPRTGKLVRFVLDVQKSDNYLARRYKDGLAEWKENLL